MCDNKEADVLCVVINIFSDNISFKSIRNCFCRLVDDRNHELCRFNLTDDYDTEAMTMCHVEKRMTGCLAMITDIATKSVHDAMRILCRDKDTVGVNVEGGGLELIMETKSLMNVNSRESQTAIQNPESGINKYTMSDI